MRITIFINEISGGGAERVACNIANYLQTVGNSVNILTLTRTDVTYPLDKKICVSSLVKESNIGKVLYFYKLYKELKRYVKCSDTDCYIVFLPVATCLLLACRRFINVPVIASERSAPNYAYSSLMQKLLRILCSRADAYVFQTEDVKKWYEPNLKNTFNTIIPNPINPEFMVEGYKGERRKAIVTAGRLDHVKNHDLLLRSFKIFLDKHEEYILEIYGEGKNRRHIEELARDLKIENKVSLKGNVQNLTDNIISASLFVLTSDYEGMPNALIEAMALGLPCISTDCPVGGPKFLIDNNVNGVLVSVGDCEGLAREMGRIIDNKALARKLGENAREIQKTLCPEIINREWEQLIYQVTDSPKK